MKILRLSVLLLTLLCAVVVPSPARAQAEVSFDFFYDSLAPYGDWIEVGDYGLCWTPANVDPDWTPYSDGYFAYTDGGWTWVSYEDFGGIVYHYGRWIHLDDSRWCWAPDYEWAPSWVSWRHSRDYIGWAPLPPEARWRRDVGISVWVDSECDIGPGYYHFCRPRDFGAPVLRSVIIDPAENVTIIRNTVNITNITYNTSYGGGPVVYVGGPSYDDVSLVVSRPIPALKLVRNANFDPARWREHRGPGGRLSFNAQMVGNQLIVAAPQVAPPRDPSVFKARVKVVVPADKVSKGWSLVKNPEEQKALRQEFRRQSQGLTPETAPAHAVAAADLKSVPATADPHATLPGTADRHEKPGKSQRPESVTAQPSNVPPNAPTAGNPVLKPFNGGPGSEPKAKSSNAPTATFTPNPRGSGEAVVPGNNHPRSVDTVPQDRAAEQEAAKKQAEESRQRQVEQQREVQIQQQQQFQQKQQAQQKQQSQQQPPEQQRALEARRAQDAERARQPQIEAPHAAQVQQPPPPQRPVDARHAQDAEREREKQQAEAQQHAVPAPQHSNLPPPSQPQPASAPPSKDSKDKKDKDKDKDKNSN